MAYSLPALLLVLGIGGFGVGLVAAGTKLVVVQHRQLRSFEPTTGEVVRAEVGPAEPPWFVELLGSMSAGADARTAGAEHEYGDEPKIEYEYRVEGDTYTADRLWPGGTAPFRRRMTSGNRAFAESVVEPHAPGDEVTVYYDPTAPENAFLFAERDLVSGGLLVLFGLVPIGWLLTELR